MFVSFQNDSGIRFSAHFYDAVVDKVETRSVTGWVTGDDGVSQATILVADQGLQLRVGQIQGFLAVIPNGKEAEHQELLDVKVEALKKAVAQAAAEKAIAEQKTASVAKPSAQADRGDRLRWKCSELACSHTVGCREKVMYADDGNVQIHGEISWNADDKKWDWCVRVDHYGSSDMTQLQVEAMAGRHARRMAAQVGMLFRGPKVIGIDDAQD